jgi:hypothetical protein
VQGLGRVHGVQHNMNVFLVQLSNNLGRVGEYALIEGE